MNASNAGAYLYLAQTTIDDPGASGTFAVDKSLAVCNLVSLTAESRTMPNPKKAGVILTLYMYTDGGDITVTFSTAFTENGATTFVFSDVGQWLRLQSFKVSSGVYVWRKIGDYASADVAPAAAAVLSTLTAAELSTIHNQTLATGAPAGITGGTGTVYKNSVGLSGGIYYTTIMIDLTGLGSSTTDLDVIGQGAAAAAHLGQITAAQCGTIWYGRMTCLEAPLTGVTDIDLYSATEATAKFDDGIAALTETALITAGGAWTILLQKSIQDLPVANQYLYLTCGAAGTVGTYTAGKFLIEFFGY